MLCYNPSLEAVLYRGAQSRKAAVEYGEADFGDQTQIAAQEVVHTYTQVQSGIRSGGCSSQSQTKILIIHFPEIQGKSGQSVKAHFVAGLCKNVVGIEVHNVVADVILFEDVGKAKGAFPLRDRKSVV